MLLPHFYYANLALYNLYYLVYYNNCKGGNNMYYIIKKDICIYNTITIKDANDYIGRNGYRIVSIYNGGAGGVFIEVL